MTFSLSFPKQLLRHFTHRILLPRLAEGILPLLLNGLRWCWRQSHLVLPPETAALLASQQPVVFILWHGQMYGMMHPLWQQPDSAAYHPSVVISQSLDGSFMATLAKHIGWPNLIRGAHGRGGQEAIHGMLKAFEAKNSVLVLGDGPRGPRHQLKRPLVKLLQHHQVPIVAVACHTPWLWWQAHNAWDKFEIPSLCGSFTLALSPPLIASTNEPTDAVKQTLEEALQQHYINISLPTSSLTST